MTATRRETIGALLSVGLAGCAEVSPNDDGETTTGDPVDLGQSGGGVDLVSHHFEEDPEVGPKLCTTIRNTRDAEIKLGELFCRVYDGNELVGEAYRNVAMSPEETKEFDTSFDIGVEIGDLRASTRYETSSTSRTRTAPPAKCAGSSTSR